MRFRHIAILDETTKFVNLQKKRVLDIIERHPDDKDGHRSLKQVIFHFDQSLSEITDAQDLIESLQKKVSELSNENHALKKQLSSLVDQLELKKRSYDNLSLTSEDIKDIPPELKNELSITDGDQQEFFIYEMMKDAGGAMSLDQILVGYYKFLSVFGFSGNLYGA